MKVASSGVAAAPMGRANAQVAADMAAPAPGSADALWTSITFLALFRVLAATLFLAVSLIGPSSFGLGEFAPRLFVSVSGVYCAAAIAFVWILRRVRVRPRVQLSAHVLIDILAIALLTLASGGFRSGLGVMNLITLAGAALVADRKTTLFYAATASLAILLEQLWWLFRVDLSGGTFMPVGLLALGYFATAIIVNRLAERVIFNERVARDRGAQLVDQLRINDLVIQDVQDGVLVIGPGGDIRQYNRQSLVLLGTGDLAGAALTALGPELAPIHAHWQQDGIELEQSVSIARSGRRVNVRIQAAGVAGAGLALVFLEDLSRVEEEAQKVKLVALGRLTANIAHEIRNPLSAITHAADLLEEENRAQGRERLTRIIRDNAYRLDRMVRDVLELNRRDAAQVEPIALGSYIHDFLADFARFEKVPTETFAVNVAADIVVDFDRVHLNQVLWNLVRNAWRHGSQQAGAIQLAARRYPSSTAGRIELFVIDDGPGVADALLGQLFEPFFTTFSKGTGLGLYIARELAAANAATLEYLPRAARPTPVAPDSGGVFRLRAPAAVRATAPAH